MRDSTWNVFSCRIKRKRACSSWPSRCDWWVIILYWSKEPWADYIFIITVFVVEARRQWVKENAAEVLCWAARDNFTTVLVFLTFTSLRDKWPSSSFFCFSFLFPPSHLWFNRSGPVTGAFIWPWPVLATQKWEARLGASVDHDKVFTFRLPAWHLQSPALLSCLHLFPERAELTWGAAMLSAVLASSLSCDFSRARRAASFTSLNFSENFIKKKQQKNRKKW